MAKVKTKQKTMFYFIILTQCTAPESFDSCSKLNKFHNLNAFILSRLKREPKNFNKCDYFEAT